MTALGQSYGDHVDLYFGDWHAAPAHTAYRSLTEQDLLTPGDVQHPGSKGAVLRFVSSYQHAILPVHAATSKVRLEGQQQIYFVESGTGTATSGSQTIPLSVNVAVLMPANLEFTITNTGDKPLQMYVIQEPTSSGFHPNTTMLSRDENSLPFAATDAEWAYMVKKIFVAADGLATLDEVSTIALDPLTIGRPTVTASTDVEAVWTALRGTGIAFVSNQLRRQTPGTAFLEVPDGKTPHSSINPNEDTDVKFLYFAHKPSPAAPHAN
ncbi:cupin domain-containing protein [Granulicella sp. WH15]|uniref:cupin domain-containing protein n=1 Tax=Granulicella sp. WH15 TaxID=2602070 RepID=UPI0013A55E9B|nr:cupin domain-containing protein [Granulicella sp. WH15]